MNELFDSLEYYQNHGGILAVAILGFLCILVVRGLDWMVWRRELKSVSIKASEDVGQHELNYHYDEVIKKATRDRRTGKNNVWAGEERRQYENSNA